jgi:DNA adenine methylase
VEPEVQDVVGQFATPLRYPGGKQRLTPFIKEILDVNGLMGGDYVEPYAGGAGVAIELLLSRSVNRIHLNDSSYPIYALWKALLSRPDDFCSRISLASLTVEEWKSNREVLRHVQDYDEFDVGFSTFYLNRCNRSGVLSGGVIGGLSQTGPWKMDARFPRNDLIRRVEAIALMADRIDVQNQDAELYMASYVQMLPETTLVYCDPPYYEKSSGLYLDRYVPEDHARIAESIQSKLTKRWLVSYDGAPPILAFYCERRQFLYDLRYSASRSYEGREVFIFSDALSIPRQSSLSFIDKEVRNIPEGQHNCAYAQ